MSTNGIATAQTATDRTAIDPPVIDPIGPSAPEQLTLLASPSVPIQFRLDERTRRSGLEHVSALRAQMAAQAAARNVAPERTRKSSRQIAA